MRDFLCRCGISICEARAAERACHVAVNAYFPICDHSHHRRVTSQRHILEILSKYGICGMPLQTCRCLFVVACGARFLTVVHVVTHVLRAVKVKENV